MQLRYGQNMRFNIAESQFGENVPASGDVESGRYHAVRALDKGVVL